MSKFLDIDGLEYYTQQFKPYLVESVNNGIKNLIPNQLVSGTTPYGNINYTINSDGSISISEQTAGSSNADIVIPFTVDNTGEYMFMGGINGGSAVTYKSQIALYPTMDNVQELFSDTNVLITLTENVSYAYRIRIYANKTIPTCTVYPMLCTKAAWTISHTYQPYNKMIASQSEILDVFRQS